MHRIVIFKLLTAILTLIACVVLVETLSFVFMPKALLARDFVDMTEEWKGSFRASPFFSHVWKDGNNYGFKHEVDFPIERKPNQYIIGILGGSVAAQFASQVRSTQSLKESLQGKIPSLRKKDVVILNLAVAGFKQPQQFFTFCYFMDFLDAIIELDGWNEAWISGSHGFPIEFPAFTNILYADDPTAGLKLSTLSWLDQEIRGNISKWRGLPVLRNSYFLRLLDDVTQNFVARNISGLFFPDEVSGSFHRPWPSQESGEQLRIQSWLKYSRLESSLAAKAGIQSFFFLQPSQYSPSVKIFSESEKAHAFGAGSFAASLYQKMRAMNRQVFPRPKVYFDLNDAFASETRDVFVDDCCHVNSLGNDLMSNRIAEIVSQNWH